MFSDITTDKYHTTNPYESKFGYSRGVKRGPFIFISGTTSIDTTTGKVLYPTSGYEQAKKIFSEIISAVEALGGGKDDITRVRMFVTYDEDCGGIGHALKEVLGDVGPAATMIVGARFVDKDMRVEIEADAVVFWFVSTFHSRMKLTLECKPTEQDCGWFYIYKRNSVPYIHDQWNYT